MARNLLEELRRDPNKMRAFRARSIAERRKRKDGPSFTPAALNNLEAWFRWGVGITAAAGAVSQWDDSSGNGRHLKQASGTSQPALQADGSILFDGVDNFLKCDAFTLNQPETVYILFKQVTWTSGDEVFDGNTSSSMGLRQVTSSPRLGMDITGGSIVPFSEGLAIDTYGAVGCVFNGASSVIQVNGTSTAADPGATANAGGFTLGARGGGAGFGNIQCKEVIIFSVAHDAATRQRVIAYLMGLI